MLFNFAINVKNRLLLNFLNSKVTPKLNQRNCVIIDHHRI